MTIILSLIAILITILIISSLIERKNSSDIDGLIITFSIFYIFTMFQILMSNTLISILGLFLLTVISILTMTLNKPNTKIFETGRLSTLATAVISLLYIVILL